MYPLEVHSGDGAEENKADAEPEDPRPPEASEEQEISVPADTSTTADDSPTPTTRPQRAAALQARDHLMASALADAEDC